MTERRKVSFQQQGEENVETAALEVARGIQVAGQTKEQTKQIAQGIAKGIALYKKQQSQKAREREKARKRLLKERAKVPQESWEESDQPVRGSIPSAPLLAIRTAGMVFGSVSLLHFWRFFTDLPLTLGTWSVPVWWSLPAGIAAAALAAWMFFSGSKLSARVDH